MGSIDVVDDNDRVIGKASEKEIYEKRLNHRIIHIFIFNDKGEMALQLRSKHKPYCPNHWSATVGGRVDSGEDYEEAALREMQEELGITAELKLIGKEPYKIDGLTQFLATFTARHNGPFRLNPEEVEQTEFLSVDKIKHMIRAGEKLQPALLFLLRRHFGI